MNSFFHRIVFSQKRSYGYLDILGLNQAADNPGLKNKYFYSYPPMEERLHSLRQMMKGKNLVTLVIGKRGSGKTTLLNRFLKKYKLEWRLASLPLSGGGHDGQTVDLPFIECRDGKLPSMIVDDAHGLTTTGLEKVLRSAWSDSRKRIVQHIILFSEPEMQASLADLYHLLPPRSVVNKIFMPPLSQRQTVAYLNHRLRRAGIIRSMPFDSNQLDKIHKTAKGLPGWINGEAFMMLRRMAANPMQLRPKPQPLFQLKRSLAFRGVALKLFLS